MTACHICCFIVGVLTPWLAYGAQPLAGRVEAYRLVANETNPSAKHAAIPAHPTPVVILDTDMLTDCDDAGALAMLHALADAGEVRILGVVLNGRDTHRKHRRGPRRAPAAVRE